MAYPVADSQMNKTDFSLDHKPCSYCGRMLCSIPGVHNKQSSTTPEYERIFNLAEMHKRGSLVNKDEYWWAIEYLWEKLSGGYRL